MSQFSSLIFYISSFSVSTVCIFLGQYNRNSRNSSYLFFTFIGLFIPLLISGSRYYVGSDFVNYVNFYNRSVYMTYSDYINSGNYELGYFTIQKIAMNFGGQQVVFFLSALITLIFICLAIKEHRYKISISLSFLIYIFIFFPSSFNIIRQHIAVAIIVFSYKYIFEKNLRKFILTCIIASSFHITAILVLPFYFLFQYTNGKINFADKKRSLLRVVFIAITFLFVMNFGYFLDIIVQLSGMDKFSKYAIENDIGNNREIFLKAIILMPVLLLGKKLVRFDNRNKLYIYCLIIDFLLTVVGFWNPFVKRSAIYFEITQIFLIPSIIKILSGKLERYIARWLIVVYCFGYFTLVYYIMGHSDVIPYNIFNILIE